MFLPRQASRPTAPIPESTELDLTSLPNWPAAWPHPPDGEPARAPGGMVVTTDRLATDVGVEVLRSGGNAVDAAVAVTFALAVVNPEAGNVGGSGFLVLRTADGEEAALDHRSTAPAAATRDMFLDAEGNLTDASVLGAAAAAVPGTVLGAWDAWSRHGSVPWEDLVEPAVRLARGFVVTERFIRSYVPHIVEALAGFPSSASIFLPGGERPAVGDTFRQPDLARTLERVREGGPDGFYRGETADLIVAEMERSGGLITHDDLASYRTAWREPVRFRYRGHTVVSMPPPSSGGIALAATCAMLEDADVGRLAWHGPRHVHLLAEVWKRVWVDRNRYMADPDFVDFPAEVLASPDYARWRASDIPERRATPASVLEPAAEKWAALTGGGSGATTHFSIVDADGAAVSFTTTLNTWYGSKLVARGTGVLLNNEMDDFAAKPGAPNHFGLVQGEANAIEPGKRSLSAMTPAIVLDPGGRLRMVVGTPGGSSIITTVFQVLSNVVDHGMSLPAAVNAPRVHHQHLPDEITFEPGGLPDEVVEALRGMRHETTERVESSGDVQAILLTEGGERLGWSDPRRGGTAGGT